MSEPMIPEVADALAAVVAASHQRGYEKGRAAGFTEGAIAQRDLMLKARAEAQEPEPMRPEPSTIVLVDEGGLERVLDRMENPDA